MTVMKRYKKKSEHLVVAVQLNLDTDGLVYQKWGDTQKAKAGDWLVDNDGSIYTIEEEVFARTYKPVSPGLYEKVAVIYAEPATEAGSIVTLEGRTHYDAGDYLVYEKPGQEKGAYAIKKQQFEKMYEQIEV